MILIDTSAWIEYFRNSQSPTHLKLRKLLLDSTSNKLAITEPIFMEILSGIKSEVESEFTKKYLNSLNLLSATHSDWIDATAIYRSGRQNGYTIRSKIDCLIAAVAINNQCEILHNDVDFSNIAKFTKLKILN